MPDYTNAISRAKTNAYRFSRELIGLTDLIKKEAAIIQKKVCLDLYRDIVEDTPHDTGRAKANWQIDIKEPSDDHPLEEFTNGGEAADRHAEKKAEKFDKEKQLNEKGDTIYIFNNLPYIEALEGGHSQQKSPGMMVALNLERFTSYMKKQAKKLKTIKGIG